MIIRGSRALRGSDGVDFLLLLTMVQLMQSHKLTHKKENSSCRSKSAKLSFLHGIQKQMCKQTIYGTFHHIFMYMILIFYIVMLIFGNKQSVCMSWTCLGPAHYLSRLGFDLPVFFLLCLFLSFPSFGEPTNCRSFFIQCEVVFLLQPRTYASERSKVAYIISLLSGRARDWDAAV